MTTKAYNLGEAAGKSYSYGQEVNCPYDSNSDEGKQFTQGFEYGQFHKSWQDEIIEHKSNELTKKVNYVFGKMGALILFSLMFVILFGTCVK